MTLLDWCNQIPMVGYNLSKYDLNIVKKYFITHIGAEKQVTVARSREESCSCPHHSTHKFQVFGHL